MVKTIAGYQEAQDNIRTHVIRRAVEANPEHAAAINSHLWTLDLSDMVWECSRCMAVIHEGERRFMSCEDAQAAVKAAREAHFRHLDGED